MTIMKTIGAIAANYESSTRASEFVSLAKALMIGRGNASEAAKNAASPRLAQILKGAIASGSTTGTGWAEEISAFQTIAAAFVNSLKPYSAFDAMADAFVQLPLHARYASRSAQLVRRPVKTKRGPSTSSISPRAR